MSHDLDLPGVISEHALSLFLEHNEPDALTDVLVAALEEALAILRDEIRGEALH